MSNNRAVIDFHTHIFPAKLAARAVTNIGGYYSLPMECDGTAEGLFRSCETLPNMRFVISSATLKPENLHHGNDYLLEEAKLHPEFIPFSSFHPLLPIKEICAELDRVKALGSKGIKMHPDFQHFNLDEPNLFPAYRYCAEIGLPILFHVGDITTDFSTPCRLYNLMDKIPELTVIAAHLGGYQEWDEADRLLIGTPMYTDISDAITFLPPERLVSTIRRHGVEKVFFGSDFPLRKPESVFEQFDALPLTEDEKEWICHRAAEKMLGL